MHQRRLVKQVAYAAGYLIFWGLLVGSALLVLIPRLPAAPAVAVPSPAFEAITVEDIDLIRHGNTADLVARLRNPNPRAGVAELPVKFVLEDANGTELASHTEISYVLPGSIQYAIALNVPLPAGVTRVDVRVPGNPTFTMLPSAVPLPEFTTFLRQQIVRTVGNAQFEEQHGVVTNNSTFDFHRVEVSVVALGSQGQVIGTGTTLLGTLRVGEQREFVVQWPATSERPERVLVLATTNVFREDNVLRVIGDPSQLR